MAETKPKNRKSAERTKQVNVALTDREAAMLDGLVREVGARRAVVARVAMLDGLAGEGPGDRVQRLLLDEDDRALFVELLNQMHSSGVLLNQIARRLNQAADFAVTQELGEVLTAVREAQATYTAATQTVTKAMG